MDILLYMEHHEATTRTGSLKRSSSFKKLLKLPIWGSGDRPVSGGRGGERRPDPVRESEERPTQDNLHNEDYDIHRELGRHDKKPASTTINRSESYKERIHKKKQLRQRRKTSDPNLSKTTNDADCDPQVNSYNNTNSGSSSNSSSTRSLESPSNSVDMVTTGRSQEAVTVTLTANSSWTLPDSDLEAEPDPPDWTHEVGEERLRCLDSREKKRQDVINELFHSERSHVRNLKVQYQVFYRPMLETSILPPDQIQLLFPNLEEMLDIHSQFSNSMKTMRRENPVVGDIADLLLAMLDGTSGENFQRAAATFCARQTIALELLKERRRKDSKLHNFLTDAEGNSLCRRLQLKDIIPTGMQRLTKYPLLFENLAKYTSPDNSEEHALVLRALDRSKEILNHVNQSVREAEDNHRLADIQRRLEKSGFEKMDHPMSGEFKNLDLTKHRLNYEGSLTWRYGKSQKLIDLHVLLLDDVIILLQKQDEKFVLKFMNTASGGERSPSLSPVIKVSTVLVRTNASDPKAIYLVNTSQNAAQIYELVASTCLESKIWFRHITEATEAYKVRDGGKNRRQDAAATKDLNETSSDASKEAGASNEVSKEQSAPSETGKEPRVPSEAGKDLPGDTSSLQGASRGPEGGESSPAPSPSHPPPYEAPSSPSDGVESDVKKLEQLRRKDETIRQALAEKQRLVADILHVPRDEFETIAELAGEPAMDKDATEVVLAAINQANQLTSLVNDNLKVTEEEAVCATSEVLSASSPRISRRMARLPGVPAYELHRISTTLHSQLTQLLNIIKDRDEEREKLRRELQRSREQLHTMHESQRRSQLNSSPSRPNSYISGSSGQRTDSEDDAGSAHEDEPIDDKTPPLEQQDDSATDVYVDALSGEAEMQLEGAEEAVRADDATVETPGD